MKSQRHAKIMELIDREFITTQEELLKYLNDEGFSVTQATVSRDIKELKLVKAQAPDGKYRYISSPSESISEPMFKLHNIFSESVKNIDSAQNIVVIKCYTGMANAVCVALDAKQWESVVGTLAGDDTIFAVMRSEADAKACVDMLKKLMSR